ncbi:hypothetical protein ACFSTI_03720 [Rhizorhabdus histidinilytica]
MVRHRLISTLLLAATMPAFPAMASAEAPAAASRSPRRRTIS